MSEDEVTWKPPGKRMHWVVLVNSNNLLHTPKAYIWMLRTRLRVSVLRLNGWRRPQLLLHRGSTHYLSTCVSQNETSSSQNNEGSKITKRGRKTTKKCADLPSVYIGTSGVAAPPLPEWNPNYIVPPPPSESGVFFVYNELERFTGHCMLPQWNPNPEHERRPTAVCRPFTRITTVLDTLYKDTGPRARRGRLSSSRSSPSQLNSSADLINLYRRNRRASVKHK